MELDAAAAPLDGPTHSAICLVTAGVFSVSGHIMGHRRTALAR